METITLILPLVATTDINLSNSSGLTEVVIAEATAGLIAGALIE